MAAFFSKLTIVPFPIIERRNVKQMQLFLFPEMGVMPEIAQAVEEMDWKWGNISIHNFSNLEEASSIKKYFIREKLNLDMAW